MAGSNGVVTGTGAKASDLEKDPDKLDVGKKDGEGSSADGDNTLDREDSNDGNEVVQLRRNATKTNQGGGGGGDFDLFASSQFLLFQCAHMQ